MSEEKNKKVVIRRAVIAGGKDLLPGAQITLEKQDATHLIATGKAFEATKENVDKVKAELAAKNKAEALEKE